MRDESDPFIHFGAAERACVQRFLELLHGTFTNDLREVWLFGSFARGDPWRPSMQMNSDIDLLVVTMQEVPADVRERLLNETDPLYLECGRQLSPQFWSAAKFDDPRTEITRSFKDRLLREGKSLYPPPASTEPG
jgi:predicted nucleotidyltransferase